MHIFSQPKLGSIGNATNHRQSVCTPCTLGVLCDGAHRVHNFPWAAVDWRPQCIGRVSSHSGKADLNQNFDRPPVQGSQSGQDRPLALYSGRWPHNDARNVYLEMSTAIQTAGTVPRFSAQCVVARPSAMPSPACATVSGLPSW